MDKIFKPKKIIIDGDVRWTVTKGHLPYEPFEDFLKHKWASPSQGGDGENTTKAYSHNLAEIGNFMHMEGYDWWDIKSSIVSSYVEWVKRGGPRLGNVRNIQRSDNKSAYAPRSINQRTGTIISCFEYHRERDKFPNIDLRTWRNAPPHDDAFKHEYKNIKDNQGQAKPKNPWKQKIKKTTPPILEPDEVEFLVESVYLLRDKLLIRIMYDVGLRIGEALGLRHEDLSPQECTVNVKSRKNENNAKVKNNAEGDGLKLSNKTMALYSEYLITEYPEEIDSDYVFVVINGSTRGQALKYINAYKMIIRVRPKFKMKFGHVKPFTPHWLRHTAGTDSMEEDETGGRATQELLRHANIQTTTGLYFHPRKEKAKERMNLIHKNREESARKRRENKQK